LGERPDSERPRWPIGRRYRFADFHQVYCHQRNGGIRQLQKADKKVLDLCPRKSRTLSPPENRLPTSKSTREKITSGIAILTKTEFQFYPGTGLTG
jgi:hypothetical protein